jgi:hypothetical protein
MPLAPTDPRTFADADMPLPPTMDASAVQQGGNTVEARPRFVPTASGENNGRRAGDKPFDRYAVRPNPSPYFLVYGNGVYPTSSNANLSTSSTSSANPVAAPGQIGGVAPVVKPFDSYNPPPAISPYMLLNSNTANGTISTYNAYVRPAMAQQAIDNEVPSPAFQGTPSYPSVFLSQGQYAPNETAGH